MTVAEIGYGSQQVHAAVVLVPAADRDEQRPPMRGEAVKAVVRRVLVGVYDAQRERVRQYDHRLGRQSEEPQRLPDLRIAGDDPTGAGDDGSHQPAAQSGASRAGSVEFTSTEFASTDCQHAAAAGGQEQQAVGEEVWLTASDAVENGRPRPSDTHGGAREAGEPHPHRAGGYLDALAIDALGLRGQPREPRSMWPCHRTAAGRCRRGRHAARSRSTRDSQQPVFEEAGQARTEIHVRSPAELDAKRCGVAALGRYVPDDSSHVPARATLPRRAPRRARRPGRR